jgi:hypothetical protein
MNLPLQLVCPALIFCIFIAHEGSSQTAFNLKTGAALWSIQDEVDSEGHSQHSGQTIGFDVQIYDSRFMFVPGFHYQRISVLNQDDGLTYKFNDENHSHHFSIPITFGWRVLDLKVIDLSAMAGGEIFFFHSLDPNDIGLDEHQFHDLFTALSGAIHTELFSFLSAEIKYRHALNPLLKERPESKLRGWSLEIGLMF